MIFFGRPLTKAFEKCLAVPNFHSPSDRCWLLLLYFFRSTRDRLSISVTVIYDTGQPTKCQWGKSDCVRATVALPQLYAHSTQYHERHRRGLAGIAQAGGDTVDGK